MVFFGPRTFPNLFRFYDWPFVVCFPFLISFCIGPYVRTFLGIPLNEADRSPRRKFISPFIPQIPFLSFAKCSKAGDGAFRPVLRRRQLEVLSTGLSSDADASGSHPPVSGTIGTDACRYDLRRHQITAANYIRRGRRITRHQVNLRPTTIDGKLVTPFAPASNGPNPSPSPSFRITFVLAALGRHANGFRLIPVPAGYARANHDPTRRQTPAFTQQLPLPARTTTRRPINPIIVSGRRPRLL